MTTVRGSFIYDSVQYFAFCACRSTGKERDQESGNDYFGARYYTSTMGRWLRPDPSGLAFADQTNPQSLNLYSYVANDPLTFIDPTGRVMQMTCHTEADSYPDPHKGLDTGADASVEVLAGAQHCPFWDDGQGYPHNQIPQRQLQTFNHLPTFAPNNPAQPQKNCGQILSGAALTVGLDAAGVVAGAIPGTGAALVTAQVAIGVAGAANAAYNKDVGASFAAIGTTQLAPIAAISEQVGWTSLQTFGGTVARALPGIGSFVSAAYFYKDATEAIDKYRACKAGIGG